MNTQRISDIRPIPIGIDFALRDAGWWYTGSTLGWTKDGIVHYMLWEHAVERIILETRKNE